MTLKLETMMNIRTPRIDKQRMLRVIENTKKSKWHEIRQDPLNQFMNLRNNMIRNKTENLNETKIDHKIDTVQLRINDNIMIFDHEVLNMQTKDRHSMIQSLAKAKNQSHLVSKFDLGNQGII